MEQVISILETALPVFLALGLGMLCRKTGFLNREAIDALKKVVINLTLPAVLVGAFATARYSASTIILPVMVYLLCCLALGCGHGEHETHDHNPETPIITNDISSSELTFKMP